MTDTYQLVDSYHGSDSISQYGDGVFETMLAVGHRIHHFDYHWTRLSNSCQRLQIALPDRETLIAQLSTLLHQHQYDYSVIKMVVSRGKGLRGYRSVDEQPCYVQFMLSPYHFDAERYRDGLSVRICQTRLAHHPLLAGMKHLNALTYVMARREPLDRQFDEGLLLDYDEHLIEGLVSNVFLMRKKTVMTPQLDGAGVSGTMRAYLLEKLPQLGYDVQMTKLNISALETADAVFLSNATNGIVPVKAIDAINRSYNISLVDDIRQQVDHPCSVH